MSDMVERSSADTGLDPQEVEARERYRELLEELRTIIPGVQVLFAFLFIAPFNQRFNELDDVGRALYLTALSAAALAIVLFLTPASFHRLAPNSLREERIRLAVRLTVAGMLSVAVAMTSAIVMVTRFEFHDRPALAIGSGLVLAFLSLWYLLPLVRRGAHARRGEDPRPGARRT
jgi:amino acid transporter